MVNEFYQGLPSNYANYEDVVLPKHESMREKLVEREYMGIMTIGIRMPILGQIDSLRILLGRSLTTYILRYARDLERRRTSGSVKSLSQELILIICLMYVGIVTTTIWIPIILLEGINLSRIISAESMLWSWIGQKITTL